MPNSEQFVAQLMIRLASGFFGVALFYLWNVSKGLAAAFTTLGNALAAFFCRPFLAPCEKITEVLSDRLEPKLRRWPLHRLSEACPILGSPRAIGSLLLSLGLITGCFLQAHSQGTLTVYLSKLFFSTPFGAIFNLILNGVRFTPAVLVSTACSTLIAWFLFTGGDDASYSGGDFPEKVIIFIYHVVYLTAGCIFAVWLANYWQILADWVSALYLRLQDTFAAAKESGTGLMKLLVPGLPLAGLLYIWVTALAVAVREYITTLGHAVLAGMLMAGLWLVLNAVLPDAVRHGPAGDIVGYAMIALTVLISECTRSDPEFLDRN